MRTSSKGLFAALALAAAVTGANGQMSPTKPPAKAGKPPVVPKYGIFEVSLSAAKMPGNPFRDARASAVFTSPSGKSHSVAGFYYGGKEWRVRFVPREHGRWRYEATLNARTKLDGRSGGFLCKGAAGRGFLRVSDRNRYRLEHEDGTPLYPIGVQTGGYFQVGFDGPASGARTHSGRRWRTVPAEQWCKAFEGAVNLLRWQLGAGTQAGCALALIPKEGPVDRFDTDLAARMDDLLRLQKKHGFSHIMILFQDMSLWGNSRTAFGLGRDLKEYKSVKAKNLPDQDRYLRYVVARFGCFVDIWELFNEDSYAPDDYLAHLAKVIRAADPYDHIITTNYARPDQKWCEIVTWHEYMGMPPNAVDAYLAKEIGKFKSHGKVVLNTEFGNQGWLSNHDPIKWRISVWTAFMNESSVLFWGMSGRKTLGRRPYRGNANAYLGPDSRAYFRVLNKFNRDMPIDMRPVASGYTEHNDIRVYALSNGKVTALYVHHFSDHKKPYQHADPLMVRTGPGTFRAKWIDPADGKVVHTQQVSTEQQYLTFKKIPPVTIDLACRIDRVK